MLMLVPSLLPPLLAGCPTLVAWLMSAKLMVGKKDAGIQDICASPRRMNPCEPCITTDGHKDHSRSFSMGSDELNMFTPPGSDKRPVCDAEWSERQGAKHCCDGALQSTSSWLSKAVAPLWPAGCLPFLTGWLACLLAGFLLQYLWR